MRIMLTAVVVTSDDVLEEGLCPLIDLSQTPVTALELDIAPFETARPITAGIFAQLPASIAHLVSEVVLGEAILNY